MDRRDFFMAGAAGAAGGLLALPAAAPGRASGAAIASYVTGLRDHLRGAEPPAAPSPVGLRREPDRAFDPHSIAVLDPEGARLGYLPASQGRVLAPLMDAGFAFEARVVEARPGPNPALRLEIAPAAA